MKASKLTWLVAVLFSVKGWSQNIQLVSLKQLQGRQLDDKTIQGLVQSEYLVPTSHPEYYFLNSAKIDLVLDKNLDLKNTDFLNWIKSAIKPEIKVKIKNSKDMYLGTQDIHGGTKGKSVGNRSGTN